MSFDKIGMGVEDVFEELFTKRTLVSAEGVQLDGYGEIVGVERSGLSDGDYRLRIGVQILINLSEGSRLDIFGVVAALLPPGTEWTYVEQHPASFEVIVDDIFTQNKEEVARNVCRAALAGVRCILRTRVDNPFEFAGGTDGSGFGEDGVPATGGNFASATEG